MHFLCISISMLKLTDYIFKFVKSMRSTIRAQKIIVIALLSILIQLNSFVTKKSFLAFPQKNSV